MNIQGLVETFGNPLLADRWITQMPYQMERDARVVGGWLVGWLVAGMAWPGRWSGDVRTAGSLCDG